MYSKTTALRLWLFGVVSLCGAFAATDVRMDFTLATTDPNGAPIQQARTYYVYRPDGLSRANPVAMVVHFAAAEGNIATFLHRKADQAGFVVVSALFPSTRGSWINDNPRIAGFEDYDYISAVIARVAAAENAPDVFVCGLSKGGHTAYAFACERPGEIKAACSADEFMSLTSNIPLAPVPILAMQGTADTNVPYTMAKDSVDAWRAVDGLMAVTPVTTYEAAPLQPGRVSRTTWSGGRYGTQVALITIIDGTHQWATPGSQTGYDAADGLWSFFSQYLTVTFPALKIVAPPVNNTQVNGLPASFSVTAIGNPPLRYQWQRNGSDIPGATNSWLTIPATTADNAASFRAVVTNDVGSATSPAATLTVTAAAADALIGTQPADLTVTAGEAATFSVTASAGATFQWRKNGMPLAGATAANYALRNATTADSGATFSVVVSNGGASVTSASATLTVRPAPAGPIVLVNPARARVLAGETASFVVTAWSPTPMTYQWQRGTFTTVMADIPGATSATYTTPPTALADHLTLLRCVVSNAAGAAVSASEMLFVTAAPTPPTDITSATEAYASPGAPFNYAMVATGGTTPLTFSATPLPDGLAIDPRTGVISGLAPAAGTYRITIAATNRVGAETRTLVLKVGATPNDWGGVRLANLATRALVGPGSSNLVAGFVVEGSAPRRLLVRAVGPGLARFGVNGVLADPRLTLADGTARVLTVVDDWDTAGPAATVAGEVGAFALEPGSRDAAAVATLAPGNYTVRVEGAASAPTGVALLEVYDADPGSSASRAVNLSTRGLAGSDPNALIAGFVIAGSSPRPVLVRAIGAAALESFGLTGGLSDPALEIYDAAGHVVAANDDWGGATNAPWLAQAFAGSGAFPLTAVSKDAAVSVTLPPGAYTAKVVNRDQPASVALIEIYQAPTPP